MTRIAHALLAALLVAVGSCAEVRGVVDTTGFQALPDTPLKPMEAILVGDNNFSARTPVWHDGTFVFHRVPTGSYLVQVSSLDVLFPQYRVDVIKGKVSVRTLTKTRVRHPVTFRPQAPAIFFQKPQGFQVGGLLSNPMVWMMGVSLILVVVMPKMMDNIDPEEMKRVQKEMKGSPLAALSGRT